MLPVQVSSPTCEAVTPVGTVATSATVVEAVAVDPVAGSVAVRIYVPGAVTTAVLPVALKLATTPVPAQEKVAPEVVEEPVRVTLVILQVSGPLLDAVTPAGSVVTEILDMANNGFPIREENKMKDIMATLYLSRSKDNFICIGLVYAE